MGNVPLFVDKLKLLEEYIQQTTGLQIDRLEFSENKYSIDVTYYGYNEKEDNYHEYEDTLHIFDIMALIYKDKHHE